MIIGISGKISSGKDTVAQMIHWLESKWSNAGLAKKDPMKSYKTFMSMEKPFSTSDWETRRFADTLKDITCMLIGCTREQLEDREFKEESLGENWAYWIYEDKKYDYVSSDKQFFRDKSLILHHHTPRSLMQLLGTEAGREIIHPNIWVNALFAEYTPQDKSAFIDALDIMPKYEYPKWIIPDTRFPNEAKAIRDRGGILIRINRPIKKRQKGSTDANARLHLKNAHPSETALDNWEDWDYIIENDGTLEDLLEKVKEIYSNLTKN